MFLDAGAELSTPPSRRGHWHLTGLGFDASGNLPISHPSIHPLLFYALQRKVQGSVQLVNRLTRVQHFQVFFFCYKIQMGNNGCAIKRMRAFATEPDFCTRGNRHIAPGNKTARISCRLCLLFRLQHLPWSSCDHLTPPNPMAARWPPLPEGSSRHSPGWVYRVRGRGLGVQQTPSGFHFHLNLPSCPSPIHNPRPKLFRRTHCFF